LKDVTPGQLRVLRFVASFAAEHGYSPTLREIGAALGIRSTNGVDDHLSALERKGYVRRSENKARSLVVLLEPDGGPNPGRAAAVASAEASADPLDATKMAFRLGVEKAEEAVASCARRRAVFGGVMLQVVDLEEAKAKIRALLGAGGPR
jgi:SOS-response transcriptional repressor LexA